MKKLLASTFLLVALFLIAAACLVASGLQDQLGVADTALVLGNTVDSEGNPSPRLKARLDRTVELYRQGYFKFVIVSGGVGQEGFPEGTAMETYLIAQGIPKEAILVDNEGIDTRASAFNSKKLAGIHGFKSVLVISQYFHLPRSRLALAKAGIAPVYSAHARFFELRDLYSIAREIPAWIKYQLQ